MQSKPELFTQLLSENANVNPKPSKKRAISHGETLELNTPMPVNISLKEAKRIVKANRAPRKPMSEEQRARALANLAKGRETIKKRKEQLVSGNKIMLQVKEKQVKTHKPISAPVANEEIDPDYEEWKNLKRKHAALQEIKQQKIQKKATHSGAFY